MDNYQLIKDIGRLTQKVDDLENTIISLISTPREVAASDDDEECSNAFTDYAHRLTYPLIGKVTSDAENNSNLCRAVVASIYEVKLLKTSDGVPTLIEVEMTRDELDDFVARNPGREMAEFLVSVKPSYEELL